MKKYLLILIFTLIFLCGCNNSNNTLYQKNFNDTYNDLLKGTELSLKTCQSYSKTWSYAIENGRDFNIEIENQKEQFSKSINLSLINQKNNIDSKMKEIFYPPKEYQQAHEKLVEMYGIYAQLYSLALNPTGSLVNYNNTVNELQSKLVKTSSEFKVLIPNN